MRRRRPWQLGFVGRHPTYNNTSPQGAIHVAGFCSASTQYSCPHPLAGWQAPPKKYDSEGPAPGRRRSRSFSKTTRIGRGVLPRIIKAYDLGVYSFIFFFKCVIAYSQFILKKR
jgi:hypothetical protein